MSSFNSVTPIESTLRHASESDIAVRSLNINQVPPKVPPSPVLTQPGSSKNLLANMVAIASPAKQSLVTTPALSHFSPWLISLVYPLGRQLVVPFYFDQIEVIGRENLPATGPLILAPTHRSRWDAVMIPYAAGHDITGRNLRFMVSADEVKGLQGWFIRRLGGFPVDTNRPAIATLRHGVDVLQNGETLVIFPEGDIFRDPQIQPLKPGLARLALQAEASQPDLGVKIVPIHLHYSQPFVPWRSRVRIAIGTPLPVSTYGGGTPKQNAKRLTAELQTALQKLSERG